MLENGADSFWYYDVGAFVFSGEETTISISGKDYTTADRRIHENDLLTVDLSPQCQRIWGDYARTIVIEAGKVVVHPADIRHPEWKRGLRMDCLLYTSEQRRHNSGLRSACPSAGVSRGSGAALRCDDHSDPDARCRAGGPAADRAEVYKRQIEYDGRDVLAMSVDERSRAGLFLAMQYPQEVPGVTNSDFLRAAMNARRENPISLFSFIKEMEKTIKDLQMKPDLAPVSYTHLDVYKRQ